jgi:hypothetical protein
MKSTLASGESPKVHENSAKFLKALEPKRCMRLPWCWRCFDFSKHAALGEDPAGASSVSEPTKSLRAAPRRPRSHGLSSAGGSQHDEGSSSS